MGREEERGKRGWERERVGDRGKKRDTPREKQGDRERERGER